MGIISTSLVSTSAGSQAIADVTEPLFTYSWLVDNGHSHPVSLPMQAIRVGETDQLWTVETWFGGGCRDCNHHSAQGLKFYVGPGTEFLLRSSDYFAVEDLVCGHRLRVIGRNCGFEEVKSVEMVQLETEIPLYSMSGETVENFGICGSNLPNTVLVRS